jgi:hypothetical protein
MFLFRVVFILVYVLLTIPLILCTNSPHQSAEIIATIDNEIITLDDFRLFYELDPNFGIDSAGYDALLDELHKYIDHSLAYRLAANEGLTDDSLFIKAKNWERKQAMLRQLYRNKVESQIDITEAELRKVYLRYNTRLHIRHLFTTNKSDAEAYYLQLKNNTAIFEGLAQKLFHDSTLSKSGGDLGWIAAGDLENNFAEAALKLGLNEISEPVKTQWGYHIIQLLGREDQIILKEADFEIRGQSLQKRIRLRKSRKLANKYLTDFMKDLNPQPVPENFHHLWNAIATPIEPEKNELLFNVMFSDELIRNLKRDLEMSLNKNLITYNNGSVTIQEYLDGLRKIPVSNRPRFKTPHQLSSQLGIWIRDELLYQEALDEELQNHPRVGKEVSEYLNQQCYLYYLQIEMEKIVVPDEVKNFFEDGDKTAFNDYPELKHLHTQQEWIFNKAEKNLHKSLKATKARVTIGYNILQKENTKIDWNNRIRMFAIRKPA